MKKNKMIALVLGLVLSLNGAAVFASSTNRPFEGFNLPVNQGNNYAVSRAKENGNDWSYVKCTGLNNTSRVTFWIANNDKTQISKDVSTGITSYWNVIDYTKDRMAGDMVRLGMENFYNSSATASVSGYVDYE